MKITDLLRWRPRRTVRTMTVRADEILTGDRIQGRRVVTVAQYGDDGHLVRAIYRGGGAAVFLPDDLVVVDRIQR